MIGLAYALKGEIRSILKTMNPKLLETVSGVAVYELEPGLLAYLGGLRETVQAVLPEGRRSAVLRDLFFACLEEGWPLEAAALEARMAAVEGEGMS